MGYLNEVRSLYRYNHIMIPYGGDFEWTSAHLIFSNLDKVLPYINNNYSNVTIMYSTPSKFLDAIYNLSASWPVRYEDMVPYSDPLNAYWTGFFTSRPTIKRMIRVGQANFFASSKLYSLKVLDQTASD
jgi:hypothetical protein